MQITPPVIQLAMDYASVSEALKMGKIGVAAGFDWIEAGTPLIVACGIPAIGELARAFPDHPVLADYKTMDSGGKNVERTLEQGGKLMTVCANAPDETILAAISAGKKTGIGVVLDTIGVTDQASRARQCAAWGADLVYLHYGADQRRVVPSKDSTQWIEQVQAAVSAPIGCGCFGVDDAVRAARQGVECLVVGHPLISGENPSRALREFVREVRANYKPRSPKERP
jgi:3-hexulose-6-phosphate synthase/6-phospho-3-hexuloisomerase